MHSIACQWRQQVKINNIRIRANEVKSQYKILKLTQIPDTRSSRQAGRPLPYDDEEHQFKEEEEEHQREGEKEHQREGDSEKEEILRRRAFDHGEIYFTRCKMLFIGLHYNGGRQF